MKKLFFVILFIANLTSAEERMFSLGFSVGLGGGQIQEFEYGPNFLLGVGVKYGLNNLLIGAEFNSIRIEDTYSPKNDFTMSGLFMGQIYSGIFGYMFFEQENRLDLGVQFERMSFIPEMNDYGFEDANLIGGFAGFRKFRVGFLWGLGDGSRFLQQRFYIQYLFGVEVWDSVK